MVNLRVPDSIKIAMQRAIMEFWRSNDEEIILPRDILPVIDSVSQAFAVALSDNPIVPTRQNLEDMRTDWEDTPEQNAEKVVIFLISEWQRRIFLAPEVPEEIKDLWDSSPTPDTKRRVVEAYRRGRAK